MIEIAKYNCKDSTEARIKEQQHYEELKSTLNSCPPYVDKKKYFCIDCNLQCIGPSQFNKHINGKLHITTKPIESNEKIEDVLEKITTINNDKIGKLCFKFYCELCDYGTSKKSSFVNHNHSKRHENTILTTKNNDCDAKLCPKKYLCDCCDKHFNDRAGLWRHKKKCIDKEKEKEKEKEKDDDNYYEGINIKDKDALVLHLLKQNGDLHNKLIEMSCKSNITNNNNNSNSHNTTNNAFNLNFFLNETCKDAMNISDFVSSIKMSLDDLENTGRQGYIEGISSIIIKNLNKLGQIDRPLHCGDNKREIIYIKDNNEWIKESDDKPILTRAIKTIANQNIKQIKTWRDKHTDCTKSDSNKNNLYLKIVSNSMNGLTKEEADKNISKIISNVAKKVTINK